MGAIAYEAFIVKGATKPVKAAFCVWGHLKPELLLCRVVKQVKKYNLKVGNS